MNLTSEQPDVEEHLPEPDPSPAAERSRDAGGPMGRNLIEPFLLVELLRGPSYGYDLVRQLAAYNFRRTEPAVVYKVLRSMEESGSIQSEWQPRETGPVRRYYALTPQGRATLQRRVRQLKRYQGRLDQLLSEYIDLSGDDIALDLQEETEGNLAAV